jgi:hypothetical protein
MGRAAPYVAARLLLNCMLAGTSAWFVWRFMSYRPPAGTPHLFDFHTFWEAGRAYAHGRDPYPSHIAGPITRADWFVYPAPVAAAAAPLGLLPYGIAWVVFAVLLVVAIAASLWLVGVRDWRCYTVAGLSLPVLKAANLGTVTPLLMLAVALMWRFRRRDWVVAASVAAAVVTKLFLWPLLPWLWFTGRRRSAVLAAAIGTVATVSAWLPLGVHSFTGYPSLLHQLSIAEAYAGYGVGGVSFALGVSAGAAALVPTILAPLLIALVWALTRRLGEEHSLAATLAAAIAMSPVVWEHYFALAILSLALVDRSFSARWLVPLVYWVLPYQQSWGSLWKCALALVLLAACAAPSPSNRQAPHQKLAAITM